MLPAHPPNIQKFVSVRDHISSEISARCERGFGLDFNPKLKVQVLFRDLVENLKKGVGKKGQPLD